MWNRLLRIRKKTDSAAFDLNSEQHTEIASSVSITNWRRIRLFLGFTLLFEILLLVFNDIPAIKVAAPQDLWLAQSYLA